MRKALLAVFLSGLMVIQGCNTTWIAKLDTIIAAVAPSLVNVLNILAIAEGKPVNTILEAKITADAANLKILAAAFSSASSAAAPTACAQVQAGVAVLGDDFSVVLQILQVSSTASQTNALAVFQAADAIFLTITALVPACATPAPAMRATLARQLTALDANMLVANYNSALTITMPATRSTLTVSLCALPAWECRNEVRQTPS